MIALRNPPIAAFVLPLLPLLALWKGGMDPRATWLLAILVSLCAVWEVFAKRERTLPRVPEHLALAFVAWTALSFFTSSTQTWGFDELVRDAALMLLLWVTARQNERTQTNIFRGVLWTVSLAAAIGIVIYALEPGRRLVGTFFDFTTQEEWPNAFASMLLLAWPLTFLLYPRRWSIVTAGVLFGCLALTGSRGAFLALCAQLSIAAGIFLHVRGRSWAQWKTPLLTLVGASVCACMTVALCNYARGLSFPVTDVQERLALSGDLGITPVTERWQYWNAALHLASDRPITGFGPDSFGSTHQRFQTETEQHTSHPHSVFLKLAAERGIPALALWAALIVWMLHAAFCHVHGDRRMLLPGIALTGVLLHNIVDTTVMIPGIGIAFWLLVGCIASRPQKTSPRPVHVLVMAIVILAMAVGEGMRPTMLRGDMELQEAADLLAQDRIDEAGVLIKKFRALSPEEPQGACMLAQFFARKNQVTEAIKYYQDAYQKGGWNAPECVSAYLELLAFSGQFDVLATLRPDIDAKAQSWVEALRVSRHGAAETDLPEQLSALIDTLILVYPEDRSHWNDLRAQAQAHAERWRTYFEEERPRGYLW